MATVSGDIMDVAPGPFEQETFWTARSLRHAAELRLGKVFSRYTVLQYSSQHSSTSLDWRYVIDVGEKDPVILLVHLDYGSTPVLSAIYSSPEEEEQIQSQQEGGHFQDRFEKLRNEVESRCDLLLTMSNPVAQDTALALDVVTCVPSAMVVGIVGERGAGKTTLLNRLLGCTDLLPTHPSETATASVTEISAWDRDDFAFTVLFVEPDQWKQTADDACELMRLHQESVQCNDPLYDVPPQLDAFERLLRKLWNDDPPADWFLRSAEELLPPSAAALVQQQALTIRVDGLSELQRELRKYTGHNEVYWPIVWKVSVKGHFPALRRMRCILMDIPGALDNPLLQQRYEYGCSLCHRLIFMPDLRNSDNFCQLSAAFLQSGGDCMLEVAVSHGSQMQEDPMETETDYVRNKLMLSAGDQGDRAEWLSNVGIFVLENKQQESASLAASFTALVQSLTQKSSLEWKCTYERYLNDAELVLASFREKASDTLQDASAVVPTAEEIIPHLELPSIILTNAVEHWQQYGCVGDNIVTDVAYKLNDCYYNTLQTLLRRNGLFAPYDLAQIVANSCVNPAALKALVDAVEGVAATLHGAGMAFLTVRLGQH
eukprot:TRINITY_DN3247_c1_g1_i2.p1 TRINITY_DN3247_c1_g1~~TRINITY_DN3247_c1_g1_i2.p1  ORF type:complete len:602 (+),score=90.68 TRINITY_DN3247_c1_g1_i2:94-1899(+)